MGSCWFLGEKVEAYFWKLEFVAAGGICPIKTGLVRSGTVILHIVFVHFLVNMKAMPLSLLQLSHYISDHDVTTRNIFFL